MKRLGLGLLEQVVWSPDNKHLAVATPVGVYLYSALTLGQIRLLDLPSDVNQPRAVCFSPSGRALAVSRDDEVVIWDLADGSRIKVRRTPGKAVQTLAFSPDEKQLAAGFEDGEAQLWRLPGGELVRAFAHEQSSIEYLFFTDRGRTLVVMGPPEGKAGDPEASQKAVFWRLRDGERTSVRDYHGYLIAAAVDGNTVAMGSTRVDVRRVRDWKLLRSMGGNGFGDAYRSIALSANGRRLAASLIATKVYRVGDGRLVSSYDDKESMFVKSLSFAPDEKRLALVTDANTLRVLRTSDGRSLHRIDHTLGMVSSVRFSPTGETVAVGDGQHVRLYNPLGTGTDQLRALGGTGYWINCVAFSPDGKRIAAGLESHEELSKVMRLWRVDDGERVWTAQGQSYGVQSIAFSPGGEFIVGGATDRGLRAWSVKDGFVRWTLRAGFTTSFDEGHHKEITSVAFSPSGKYLVTGSVDRTARLWRAPARPGGTVPKPLQVFSHDLGVNTVAFSVDERTIASGSDDDTVRLWHAGSSGEVRTLAERQQNVTSVAFSPDGTLLATASEETRVRIWRVADGAKLATLEGHRGEVRSLDFSPSGDMIVSGSMDATVRIWGLTIKD